MGLIHLGDNVGVTFHVYILFSPLLGRHYVGQTGDLDQRLGLHLDDSTPFTAQAKDWQLVFLQRAGSRQEAMALEWRISGQKAGNQWLDLLATAGTRSKSL